MDVPCWGGRRVSVREVVRAAICTPPLVALVVLLWIAMRVTGRYASVRGRR